MTNGVLCWGVAGEHTILAQTPVLSSNDAAAAKDGGELSAITTEHMYTQHGLPTRITVFRRPGEAINADESTSGGSSSNGSSTSSDACAIQGLKMEYVQVGRELAELAEATTCSFCYCLLRVAFFIVNDSITTHAIAPADGVVAAGG